MLNTTPAAIKIAPSVLSADFWRLAEQIERIEASGVEYLHLDIMDGCFVPNISYGPMILRAIRSHSKLFFDTHLMINEPDRYLEDFAAAGADLLTVHVEACTHLHRTVQKIKSLGLKAGVALNPATSLDSITEILPALDMVLLMSVNPGFSGQKFIPSVLKKASRLRAMIREAELSVDIEMDGGITMENAAAAVKSGVNVLVSGNTVFAAADIGAAAKALTVVANAAVLG